MGPTSRDLLPQTRRVVTRRPRNPPEPPGGLLEPPDGGWFPPPPLPGRFELAISLPCGSLVPRHRSLAGPLRSDSIGGGPAGSNDGQEIRDERPRRSRGRTGGWIRGRR